MKNNQIQWQKTVRQGFYLLSLAARTLQERPPGGGSPESVAMAAGLCIAGWGFGIFDLLLLNGFLGYTSNDSKHGGFSMVSPMVSPMIFMGFSTHFGPTTRNSAARCRLGLVM